MAFWAELQLYGDITLSTAGGLQPGRTAPTLVSNVDCNPLGLVCFLSALLTEGVCSRADAYLQFGRLPHLLCTLRPLEQ